MDKNILKYLPFISKQDYNNVNEINKKLKECDYELFDSQIFLEHKPCSNLFRSYDRTLNRYYEKVENGNKYLIYYYSFPNIEYIEGNNYDSDSDSDSRENELFDEYIESCNNRNKLSKLKKTYCYDENYNLYPSEFTNSWDFESNHTKSFDIFPIVIGKILDNKQINFFNKNLEKIYDISTIYHTKTIKYECIKYLRSCTNRIYNTKINYNEEDNHRWILYSLDHPERYLNKHNLVGTYDSNSNKINFTKGFLKTVHNKIKTVSVDNDIREASHIERNRDSPGAYLVWYKCPTCSNYHQHGIPYLNGGISNNIGYTTERCTHCLYETYGPSEDGLINVVITPNTKMERPKIGKRKFNDFAGKKKILYSNFCTDC